MPDRNTSRPTTHSDEELSELVLDLAQQSFIEHGFRGTKMEQLAKRAGVSVGQLYHVFANKEALYLGVHERAQRILFVDYLEPAYAAGPESGDSIAHFKLIAHAYVRFYLDHREMGPLLTSTTYEDRHEESIERVLARINEQVAGGLARLYSLVDEGIKRGEIRPVDPAAVIRWFWGGVFGVLALNLRYPSAALDDEQLQQVVDVGLESIAALLRPDE